MAYLKYDGSTAAETPTPVSNLYGTSAGNETLTATSGHPQGLYGQGDGDRLIGSGAGDTYYFQGADIRVEEPGGGAAKIVAWQNIWLGDYANVRNLEVGGGNTYAAGNSQDNVISVTGSNQELYGGAGQDVLVGNGQGDTFVIVKGEGNDAIYNFNAASDVVRLNAGYKSFAEVQSHLSQVGADVKLDMGGGDALVFRNLGVGQLKAANFQLGLDTSKLGAVTFNDDFNSLSLWNGASGTWATTFWYDNPTGNGGTLSSNGEQQWYVNANYAGTASVKPWTVANGVLTLTAAPASPEISAQINGYRFTSGEVNTFHSFAQQYGYFEMRADVPDNVGGWPAFWLMPTDGSWPPELDVMEILTKDPHADWTTVHSAATGTHSQAQGTAFIPDTASGYHTYGVLWTEADLTWYVDGVEVFKTATPADMHKPMYMMANLALGGWGGDVDASQLPAQFKIDYIRAYGLADAASGGGDAPASGGSSGGGSVGGGSIGGGSSGGGGAASGQALSAPAHGGSLEGGGGADTLLGGDHGANRLRGGDGADAITGGLNGFNDINGNKGDDKIVGRSAVGDWLLGGQGNDRIDATQSHGHNIINGNLGNDVVLGGQGGDMLRGGQGDDRITGGVGDDWITGDLGANTVTGGAGADIFRVAGGGVTYVTDFHVLQGDRVQLDRGTHFGAYQAGADVHVDLTDPGGGSIVLQNVQLTSLQAGWFFQA